MNIVVEKKPKCVATLRVEIPSDRVKREQNKVSNDYASKARIPGFRPGKAPRAVIEKRYAREISEQVQETLINEAMDEALEKESLKVLDFGVPQDLTTHEDGSISFVSEMTLAPEVQLPEYKGVEVTIPPYELPEADVDAQLKALQERFADFNDIGDRGAEMEDFAVIDYTSSVEGKPTDEFLGKPPEHLSGREGFWIRLNEEAFLPGFASQLVGIRPDESREVTITLPEDFPVEELRSKEMVFQTTVKELKQAVLPELDDEFANRIAPGQTMDDLKTIIAGNMQTERNRKIDDMKVNQIIAHIVGQVDFELPEAMLSQETQSQADDLVQRSVKAGMSEEEVEAHQQEIFESAGSQAAHSLRTNFILQEIARAENITIDDRELVSHLSQIAESRNVPLKKFVRDLRQADRLGNVRQSMVLGKTIDFLVEHANVTESNDIPADA